MSELLSNYISFEGERGTGKSTQVQLVSTALQEYGTVRTNRDIETGKKTNTAHLMSLEMHREWERLVIDGNNPERAEEVSRMKFQFALEALAAEELVFRDIRGTENTILLCDRDIDSVVLYAAVEIIMANKDKYQSKIARSELIQSLWIKVRVVKELPDITFVLTTNQAQNTLERSYLSKQETDAQFSLTQIQTESQELASELIEDVIHERPSEADKALFVINVDGKRPDEIAKIIKNLIFCPYIRIPEDETVPVVRLRGRNTEEITPTTLKELIQVIDNSTSGSAFPSYDEVRLGFSNCVYSNASLVYWARELGLGNLIFTSVDEDSTTNTNPVHWVAFEIIDDSHGRVIDITPFHAPIVSSEVDYTLTEQGEYILADGTFSRLKADNPVQAAELMQLAYLSQLPNIDIEGLRSAQLIYCMSEREEYRVFAGIRLLRMLEKIERDDKIDYMQIVVRDLVQAYPDNLLVIREIMRIRKTYNLLVDDFSREISQAQGTIAQATRRMNVTEAANFLNYYAWIVEGK